MRRDRNRFPVTDAGEFPHSQATTLKTLWPGHVECDGDVTAVISSTMPTMRPERMAVFRRVWIRS